MRIKMMLSCCLVLLFLAGHTQQKKVTLDYYFNHEFKKNSKGELVRFHYMWEDTVESGYSKWGNIFKQSGFVLGSLDSAPTVENLKGTSVYLIVDPDTELETAKPNYIEPEHIKAIRNYVKHGGILVVMANDSGNVEFKHLNKLTESFGIHLNEDSKSKVYKNNYEMGAFYIPAGDPIFTTAHKVYMKEVTSLQLYKNAVPVITHQTEKYIVAAKATYGKGTVLVIGDPWFYNEYLNGHLGNNNGWENDKAAADLSHWLFTISK